MASFLFLHTAYFMQDKNNGATFFPPDQNKIQDCVI